MRRLDPLAPDARVALFGEFGVGNMGNDISCATVLGLLRDRQPRLRLGIISRNAAAAAELFGLPAASLSAGRARGAPWPGRLHLLQRVWSKLLDLAHLVRLVGRYDVVIVPGTGMLEAATRRNPGGVLVWLALLSLACRLRRVHLVWFALGGGRYRYRWPGLVAVLAARGAGHRSFRDALTAQTLRTHGLRLPDDPVVRDVVFAGRSVPPPVMREPRPVTSLAVAAIDLAGPGRSAYFDRLAATVAAQLEMGREVVLVVGDDSDEIPTDEVLRRLGAGPGPAIPRLRRVRRGDFAALSAVLAEVDLVVASRYHVLIAALRQRVPVIAVSHADKDDELLRQFDLLDYLIPIEDVDPDRVERAVTRLEADQAGVAARLEHGCAEAEKLVRQDFAMICDELRLADNVGR